MNAMAQGDLNQSIRIRGQAIERVTNDEIGDLATAFNHMLSRLQVAGQAFGEMTAQLRELVGQVADNAGDLRLASDRLAYCGQAGHATRQIGRAIQEVTQGSASNPVGQPDSRLY
jgi:methyl-accepting chemotaxis protein